MRRKKAILNALKLTPWFIVESWSYITTKQFSSKVKYFTGIIPAWLKFTYLNYKDFRNMPPY